MAGILIASGFSMGAVINLQNNQILTAHTNADIRSIIKSTGQLINFYFNRAESSLTSLANDPSVLDALKSKDQAAYSKVSDKITTVNDASDVFENIALMEIDGTSCIPRATNKEATAVLGRDFSDRDYCQGIIKSKSVYLSSAYISAITNSPVIGLVIPVKNVRGEMSGFIYGSINLNELRGYLWDLQDNSKVELLDRYGVMFLNTEEIINVLNNVSAEENIELDSIKSKIASGANEGIFRDENNFVGYNSNGLITVIYEKSASDLLTLAGSLNWTVFLSLLITMLAAIIVIYLLIVPITRRISRLSNISQEIAGGKFNIKMNKKDMAANDETAALARAFNDMANKLASLYRNLDQKVKDRTKKLEESEKITKKSLELSERANKLMVGRELEMIKLKKEIEQIKNSKQNEN